jgi:hypothetical protein
MILSTLPKNKTSTYVPFRMPLKSSTVLSQITRYKSRRKEPNTDDYDIKLIQSFMKNCIPWNNSSGINNDNNVNVCYNNFKY